MLLWAEIHVLSFKDIVVMAISSGIDDSDPVAVTEKNCNKTGQYVHSAGEPPTSLLRDVLHESLFLFSYL